MKISLQNYINMIAHAETALAIDSKLLAKQVFLDIMKQKLKKYTDSGKTNGTIFINNNDYADLMILASYGH